MRNNISKYDIWLIDLNPTKGSEQSWIRPCLIFQSNIVTKYTNTFIVLPITGKEKRTSPIVVKLENYKDFWLTIESTILTFQIRTADESRFIRKIWEISDLKLRKEIKESLITSIDIDDDF